MDDFVQLAQEMGNRQRALRLEAAVSKLREATGTGLRDMLAKREWVPGPAGPEETKFWEDGRRMSKEDAIEYALQAVPVTSER
jgi:hypothetical protein